MGTCSGHILIVDDDSEMQVLLRRYLTTAGYRVTTCSRASEAEALLAAPFSDDSDQDFDLLISDVNMPEMNGLDFIQLVRERRPNLLIIMVTAFGSIQSAVLAMNRGASDYLTKPLAVDDLLARIEWLLEQKSPPSYPPSALGDMLGQSPQMREVFSLVKKVAQVNTNVLILGASGTGKEMVARAIHHQGPQATFPFIAINCAALPEHLLESELFGHARGSFTGAVGPKRGLFEEAEGGTLFLDEIGDMNVGLQAKLLRVIQERRFRAVGQNNFKEINVRILAATHRNLKELIAEGKFREDLYFRLSVIPIFLPTLRERREDIPLFAEYFLKKFSLNQKIRDRYFTPGAIKKLLDLDWEGNVRQLENTIERAAILTDGRVIDETHIAANFSLEPEAVPSFVPLLHGGEVVTIKEMEKRCLEQALTQAGGRKEKAAQLLGISRKTLYRKEKEFGL